VIIETLILGGLSVSELWGLDGPHLDLRRTFASILAVCDVLPRRAMYLMGHTDPTLTLAVYQQVLDMGKGSVELLEQTLGCALPEASRSDPVPGRDGGGRGRRVRGWEVARLERAAVLPAGGVGVGGARRRRLRVAPAARPSG